MTSIAIRNIPRADPAAVAELAKYGSATVHEAMGRAPGLMAPWMRPAWAGAATCGTAVTVLALPGDNWMLHVAAEMLQPGDVLVVALASACEDGLFGELLATSYVSRGCKGLVMEAGVRDVRALTAMQFPVWSRTISARGTVKATPGSVNIPIICGGTLVHPGDVIVADDDGVVVVPRAEAATIAAASAQREAKEDAVRARLAAGELGLDIYGMRENLKKAGLVWRDESP